MAEAIALEELHSELTCPVCLELFREPVILECGHHFCRVCITQCWEVKADELPTCPKCRKSCAPKLRPNSLLCNVVDSVRKVRAMDATVRPPGDPEGAQEEPEERELGSSMSSVTSSIGYWPRLVMDMDMCEEHEEKLKLYCEDDQVAICLVCGMSRDHKTHNVIPINEAFDNYKVTFKDLGVSGSVHKNMLTYPYLDVEHAFTGRFGNECAPSEPKRCQRKI